MIVEQRTFRHNTALLFVIVIHVICFISLPGPDLNSKWWLDQIRPRSLLASSAWTCGHRGLISYAPL